MMPFVDEDLQWLYEDVVKPIVGRLALCERGDDAFGSNIIMDDILTKIQASTFAIADLTHKNANVFYELGICHALGKEVLLLSRNIEDLPFDIRHRRVLFYDFTPQGISRFKTELSKHLTSIVKSL